MTDDYAPLSETEIEAAPQPGADAKPKIIAPPDGAPTLTIETAPTLKGRAPDRLSYYQTATGWPFFAVGRWDTRGDEPKEIRPIGWREGVGWRFGRPAGPLPPYGALRLATEPAAPVIIVEGEACADAAAEVFGAAVIATTWASGAGSVHRTDWASLSGRRVLIWRDADDAGMEAEKQLVAAAFDAGAGAVLTVDPGALFAALGNEGEPPKGWDIADAAQSAQAGAIARAVKEIAAP